MGKREKKLEDILWENILKCADIYSFKLNPTQHLEAQYLAKQLLNNPDIQVRFKRKS